MAGFNHRLLTDEEWSRHTNRATYKFVAYAYVGTSVISFANFKVIETARFSPDLTAKTTLEKLLAIPIMIIIIHIYPEVLCHQQFSPEKSMKTK